MKLQPIKEAFDATYDRSIKKYYRNHSFSIERSYTFNSTIKNFMRHVLLFAIIKISISHICIYQTGFSRIPITGAVRKHCSARSFAVGYSYILINMQVQYCYLETTACIKTGCLFDYFHRPVMSKICTKGKDKYIYYFLVCLETDFSILLPGGKNAVNSWINSVFP